MRFDQQPWFAFAPMATLSHAGFRQLTEDWGGCACYFTEMIDAGTHLAGSRFEHHYADASPCPEKVVFQIVGANEDDLVGAAASLAHQDCAGIDINMGCSAPHIYRHGAGIAWMTDPAKAERLAARLRAVVPPSRTLSFKFRLGEAEDQDSLVRFGRALQNAGADFVTLHPRVRRDSLSRPARWEWVPLLRSELSIPVIGNGDLDRWTTVARRRDQTPVDGWMVGRRAVTAPWTFRLWTERWSNPGADFPVDLQAVTERFHELLERFQPREFWVSRSRRFYAYFSQNLPFGNRWGAQLQQFRDYRTLRDMVAQYWTEHPDERHRSAADLER